MTFPGGPPPGMIWKCFLTLLDTNPAQISLPASKGAALAENMAEQRDGGKIIRVTWRG